MRYVFWRNSIRRIVVGARSSDAQDIGFDEGPKTTHWREELEKRGIQTICDVDRDLAAKVLVQYSQRNGRIYNSRESVINTRKHGDGAPRRRQRRNVYWGLGRDIAGGSRTFMRFINRGET